MNLIEHNYNEIAERVDKLFLPDDICKYLKLDFEEFINNLKNPDSELYDIFYKALEKCENEIKEKEFSPDSEYTPEQLNRLVAKIDNYKILLSFQLDEN